jgi:hypothetical protein
MAQRRRRQDGAHRRCVRLAAGGDTAEAAIAVVDHRQARGVGRLLLADLCNAARELGIRRFRGKIMLGNEAVVGLLHEVGAKPVAAERNIAVYELDVPGAPGAEPAHGILLPDARVDRAWARDAAAPVSSPPARGEHELTTTGVERSTQNFSGTNLYG